MLVCASCNKIKKVSKQLCNYRIASIFRGYTFFTDLACTANIFIPTNLIPHAVKGCYSAKIKSAKTFLMVFPRKFIPSKYTSYTVHEGEQCYRGEVVLPVVHLLPGPSTPLCVALVGRSNCSEEHKSL